MDEGLWNLLRVLKKLPAGHGIHLSFERSFRHLLTDNKYVDTVVGNKADAGRNMVLRKQCEVLETRKKVWR